MGEHSCPSSRSSKSSRSKQQDGTKAATKRENSTAPPPSLKRRTAACPWWRRLGPMAYLHLIKSHWHIITSLWEHYITIVTTRYIYILYIIIYIYQISIYLSISLSLSLHRPLREFSILLKASQGQLFFYLIYLAPSCPQLPKNMYKCPPELKKIHGFRRVPSEIIVPWPLAAQLLACSGCSPAFVKASVSSPRSNLGEPQGWAAEPGIGRRFVVEKPIELPSSQRYRGF